MNIDKEMKLKTNALIRDEIVKLIDADLQDNITNDIRALTARISDAETIATPTEAETHDDARRYLIAASIGIEDGEPSHATKSKTPTHHLIRRCYWCGRVISDRMHDIITDTDFTFVCKDCFDWKRDDGGIIVTRLNAKLETAEPEILIYETLAPGECLIISKDENSLLVARNDDGELVVKRVYLEDGIDE